MGPETGSRFSIQQEVENYLAENYPVRKVDVKEILDTLKNQSERAGETANSVIEYHIKLTIDLAKQHFFDEKPRRGGPETLNVPARLTAIMLFDKKHSKDLMFPRMKLSRYVGILAIGEISGMLRSGDAGRSFNREILDNHAIKLNRLVDYQHKLREQGL